MRWRGLACASLSSLTACALTKSFDGFSDRYGAVDDGGGADGTTVDGGPRDDAADDAACGGRCPVLLTRGPPKVEERMVVTATDVYWGVEDKTVVKCSIDGCAQPSVVSSNEVKLWAFVASADTVYWTNDDATLGNVRSCATAGCNNNPTNVAKSRGTGIGIAGSKLYWANNEGASGAILSCDPSSCASPSTFVAIASPKQLAIGGGHLVWGGAKAVYDCPITGCTSTPPSPVFTETENIGDVAVDANSIYWASDGNAASVNKCPHTGCVGQPTALAMLQTKPRFAIDNTDLYWTVRTATGSIMRCALDGCGGKPETLAAGQANPKAIAVDANTVYWANDDGSVWKLAKR